MLQFWNARSAIVVTLLGIEMLVNPVQLANADFPIDVVRSGITNCVNDEQSAKAFWLIAVMLSLKMTSSNDVQPQKKFLYILVNPVPRSAFFKPVQFWKTPYWTIPSLSASIEVILFGIVISVNEVQPINDPYPIYVRVLGKTVLVN